MKKTLFERFINKYSLGGAINSVCIESTGDTISVSAITEDRSAVVNSILTTSEFEKGIYPIFDTNLCRGLIGVLSADFAVKVKKHEKKNMALQFKDDSTVVTVVLADKDVIKASPKQKSLPDFENVIDIDSIFIEKFVKSKSALPDVKTFTFVSDGETSDIVLGYSNMNTDRISMRVSSKKAEKIDPIDFHATYMKDLLAANKEAESGTIEISSQGLARISFTIDEFEVKYFLMKMEREF